MLLKVQKITLQLNCNLIDVLISFNILSHYIQQGYYINVTTCLHAYFSQVATSHGFQLGPREILAAHPHSVVSHSHVITKLLPKKTE